MIPYKMMARVVGVVGSLELGQGEVVVLMATSSALCECSDGGLAIGQYDKKHIDKNLTKPHIQK